MKSIALVVFGFFFSIVSSTSKLSGPTPIRVSNGDSEKLLTVSPIHESFMKIRTQGGDIFPVVPQKKCDNLALKLATNTVKCGWTSCASCCQYKQLYDKTTYFVGEEGCIGYGQEKCSGIRIGAARCASTTTTAKALLDCFASWFDTTYPREHRMVFVVPDTGALLSWSTTNNAWGATVSNEEDERIHLFLYSHKPM